MVPGLPLTGEQRADGAAALRARYCLLGPQNPQQGEAALFAGQRPLAVYWVEQGVDEGVVVDRRQRVRVAELRADQPARLAER